MQGYQRSLLIDESPLQVIPTLARAIGLNEAIMLQQIHYWSRISEHERDERRWVPMSAPDLAQKFSFWSEATIKRTVARLREIGLLFVTKKSHTSWERANWYAVNYQALNRLNLSIGSKSDGASDQSDPVHHRNLTLSTGAKRSDQSGQIDPITIEGKKKNKKDPGGASPTLVSLQRGDKAEVRRPVPAEQTRQRDAEPGRGARRRRQRRGRGGLLPRQPQSLVREGEAQVSRTAQISPVV